MALSLYVERQTALHRRHPVAKVVAMAMLFVAVFLADDPLVNAPILVLVIGAITSAGALETVRRLRWLIVPIFVFTTLIWAVFYPAQAGGVASRGEAWRFGFGMAVKLETFLLTGLVFLATTTVEEFAFALTSLGVPYRAGFVLTLACRLVPVFLDAALTVVDAQRCRGLDLTSGGLRTRIARYVPVIVPVFIGGLRRADQMAFALEVRGLQLRTPAYGAAPAAFGLADWALVLGAAAVMALYLVLWAHGIGRVGTHAVTRERRLERRAAGVVFCALLLASPASAGAWGLAAHRWVARRAAELAGERCGALLARERGARRLRGRARHGAQGSATAVARRCGIFSTSITTARRRFGRCRGATRRGPHVRARDHRRERHVAVGGRRARAPARGRARRHDVGCGTPDRGLPRALRRRRDDAAPCDREPRRPADRTARAASPDRGAARRRPARRRTCRAARAVPKRRPIPPDGSEGALFAALETSYTAVPDVLAADRVARRGTRVGSPLYYRRLDREIGARLADQVGAAAVLTAALWEGACAAAAR